MDDLRFAIINCVVEALTFMVACVAILPFTVPFLAVLYLMGYFA